MSFTKTHRDYDGVRYLIKLNQDQFSM